MNRFVFILLFCGGISINVCWADDSYFKMRGVVLSVEDLETVDWAKMAHDNGINTIGAHFLTDVFFQTEKGKRFLADCKKYNISIENQCHAMAQLLPRELFYEDSTLFRMDESGSRVNDCNLCVHSQKALDLVAEKALQSARLHPSDNHRYYFWIDDGRPMCFCPKCSEYSDSEQALIVENAMIKALRSFDSEAQLAHLAYHKTISAPRRVKPEAGIFLEFAPFERTWEKPLSDEQAVGRTGISHRSYLQNLKENLTVFPVETAVILEYWMDVSLFSGWEKPAVKLPWNKEVFESDIALYADLGIQNITSFAVYVDDKYLAAYDNDIQFLKDYGFGLKNFKKENADPEDKDEARIYSVASVKNGLITIDGRNQEPSWSEAIPDDRFFNPWEGNVCPKTSLSLLHDDKYMYFFFDAKDDDLILLPVITDNRDIGKEDRLEFFFSRDNTMDDYYCLEMDPKGRILSYKCSYYRNYEFDWDVPDGFMVTGRIHDYGYSLEGAIPLAWLSDFFQDDGFIYSGFYRAEFSKKDNAVNEHWLTWKDPITARPDFHVPTSLGKIYLPKLNRKR